MSTVLERKRASAANARAVRKARLAAVKAAAAGGGKPSGSQIAASEYGEPIDPTMVYSYAAIRKKFGIGRSLLRRFELAGMPVGGAGNRKFVRGAALIKAIKAPRKRAGSGDYSDPINPEMAYSYASVVKNFGIGRATLRRFELAGMPVFGAANRKFVRGAALIEAIERNSKPAAVESAD